MVWDLYVHSAIFKLDNQHEPTVQYMELCSILCGSLDRRDVWIHMRETQVRFLDREDPLEKEMASHSSTPAWKIPWVGEPGGLLSMGSHRVRHD